MNELKSDLIPFARVSHYLKKNCLCITFKGSILKKDSKIEFYFLRTKTNCLTQTQALEEIQSYRELVDSKSKGLESESTRNLRNVPSDNLEGPRIYKSFLSKIWAIKKDRAFIECNLELAELEKIDVKGFWLCLPLEVLKKMNPNEFVYYSYHNVPVESQNKVVAYIKNYFHNGANGVWVTQIQETKKEVLIPDVPQYATWNETKKILLVPDFQLFL